MSALRDRPATETVCPNCDAHLAPDQDWCLECGSAVKIRIRTAPDWRVPLAIVGTVVTLAAAAFVFLLVSLSNSANRSAAAAVAAPTVKTTPAVAAPKVKPGATAPSTPAGTAPSTPAGTAPSTPAATGPSTKTATSTTAAATAGIGSWPSGVTGYTVVLGVIPGKAAATTSATKIASAGIPVGVLDSSDYSSMTPGDWIVFSGTYTTRAEAATAASQLQAKGQTGAYPFSVVPAPSGATGTTAP